MMKPLKTKVSITLDDNIIDTIKKYLKKMTVHLANMSI